MLALCGLAACVESGKDSTSTDTDQATTGEPGTSATVTTAPSTGSDDGSTASTGAEPGDPCLAFAEPCPAACVPMTTYSQAAGSCDLDLSDKAVLCVSPGEPLGPGPTTYYAEIDGETRYAVVEQPCTFPPSATPIGWTECSGAPGEPEPCSCLCGAQGCPAEAELLALAACGLPEPCGEALVNDTNAASDYDLCVLAALRDRTPGAYASIRAGSSFDHSRVFLGASGAAQLVHRQGDDLCFSILKGSWEPARTCTLRPPAWFDACIAEPTIECLRGESWFDGCVEQPASCP